MLFLTRSNCREIYSRLTFGFLLVFLLLLLEEVVTGDSERGNQHNKLIEIHLVVFVRVQVVHDFLHQHRILLRLKTKHRGREYLVFRPLNELLRFSD